MNAPTSGSDPYEILGVVSGTPFAEVKTVYRRLVRELHPDVNPSAREHFDAVQAAFESLRIEHAAARPVSGTAPISVTELFTPAPTNEHPPPPRSANGTGEFQEIPPSRGASPRRVPTGEVRETFDPGERANGRAYGAAPAQAAPEARGAAVMPHVRIGDGASGTGMLEPDTAPAGSPEGQQALNVVVVPGRDRLLLQPRAQMLYVLLELKLGDFAGSSQQPLNLSLVLDHSSSMQRDDKLQRLKEAVGRIIDMMNPRDYLSIVTFGDRAQVLLPSSVLGNKRKAKEALDGIRCRGGTEISTGIRAGLQELQTHSGNLISQMIVLTDGQTYGDEDLCLALATQAGERQVQITALGLGDDWNSALLDELSGRTGGHADYVQSADHLAAVFEDHLRSLQLTALRNLSLDIGTGISSRVLRVTWVAPGIKPLPIPAEAPPSGQPLTLDLGRVSTDRDYRLLLELVVAARTPGPTDVADVRFTYDVPSLGRERETVQYHLSTTFVERWESDPPVDLRVHDALRKITAHRLQEQAMQAIQEGQTQKGTASLRTAAKHLEAAGCGELADLAKSEADRVERQGQAQAGNMKRIIYGTRRLG